MAKVGRPAIYGEDLLKRAKEYVDNCEDTDKEVNLPSIEGLAYELHVGRSVLYDWERDHPEFLDIMEDLRAKQARALLNKGLSGKYNSTIAKVLLTKHGYREGIEQTGHEGTPLIPESQLSPEDQELLRLIKERERNSRTKTLPSE